MKIEKDAYTYFIIIVFSGTQNIILNFEEKMV